MGTKYTNQAVSGYNASPPPDDGSTSASNKVTWAVIKTKLGDALNNWATAINAALLNALDTSCTNITGTYTTLASDNARTIQCNGTFTISLGDAVTLGAGWWCNIVNTGTGTITISRSTGGNTLGGVASNITLAPLQATTVIVNQAVNGFNLTDCNSLIIDNTDTTKQFRFDMSGVPTGTTVVQKVGGGGILPAGIGPLPYSGSSIPNGWLYCDGAAISRTTYAALFAAISTTWGVGDGATTFNLPDMRGRTVIGDGTGTVVEACTASSGNGFIVVSNSTKWITGQPVVLSNLTGFTTSATAGPTYYVNRISSTNIRLATTLALAQNNTPDVTISGSGTVTVTVTLTARTLGQNGGEESHATSITELLAHTHIEQSRGNTGGATDAQGYTGGGGIVQFTTPTASAGGNAAANVMQPFVVAKYIISY
jgi:microcystin-dependent protein